MSESTEYSDATVTAKPVKTSFWEDAIEIFIHPADVYRRRQNESVWPPMLFVALLIGIIGFATFNTLEPVLSAEFSRNMSKAMAKNPQMTQEMADKMRDTSLAIGKYTFPVIMLVTMFIVGVVTWVLSKLFGAATTFHQGLVVAAWAYFPRIFGSIAAGVQGLVSDTSNITSMAGLSLSPARFMDPVASNQLLFQLALRLDLTVIWETILLGVGVYVTGKVSKGKAIAFAILIFIVGSLPAIRNAYMMM